MSYQTILNGTFDNDPSAEKTRLSFDKVKAMLLEIYAQIPFEDSDIATKAGQFLRVNAGETELEWAAIAGGGDLLASNNLSELTATASTARTNLGLKSAAVADLIDEDTMVSNDATKVPSQQSVKAYVDSLLGTGYTAGTGISIAAGVITNTNTSNNVTAASFAPSTGVLTLTLESGTVTVNLSAYTVLKIDGFIVTKGSGNTSTTAFEVGDFGEGWENGNKVAFKVTALPYTTAGNRIYAHNDTPA